MNSKLNLSHRSLTIYSLHRLAPNLQHLTVSLASDDHAFMDEIKRIFRNTFFITLEGLNRAYTIHNIFQ